MRASTSSCLDNAVTVITLHEFSVVASLLKSSYHYKSYFSLKLHRKLELLAESKEKNRGMANSIASCYVV